MKKLDILAPPELPEIPLPGAAEIEYRLETLVNKALAIPVAKIVSKVVTTPLMIVEKVTDGLREATIAKKPEEPETGEEEPEKVAQKEGGKEKNGEKE